ncbi:hypothetical protein STEG23_006498, partial [Scotinomys teguina]
NCAEPEDSWAYPERGCMGAPGGRGCIPWAWHRMSQGHAGPYGSPATEQREEWTPRIMRFKVWGDIEELDCAGEADQGLSKETEEWGLREVDRVESRTLEADAPREREEIEATGVLLAAASVKI